MKKRSFLKGKGRGVFRAAAAVVLSMCILAGCGSEDKRHTIKVVTGDVSAQYELALAEYHDVELIQMINCTYSQVREDKLCFELDGYRVGNVFVEEGQDVKEGDLVAELDISSVEKEVSNLSSELLELDLSIRQAQEMIDFYDSRINSSAFSLALKEQYTLSKEEYEEKLIQYNSSIEYDNSRLEKDRDIIAHSKLYSTMDGTVSSIKDNIMDWTSNKATSVITIIDSSICAFQATDEVAAQYLKVGDGVDIVLGNGASYPASVSSVDKDSFKISFELDDPDFSLTVGTKGMINQVIDRREQVLSVPRLTVFNTDEYYYVFTLSESGVRELQKVEVGLIGTDYVEILSGLELHSSVILR